MQRGMRGRVCIVTGASSGIGLETARQLGERGARLRITGRDPERLAGAERALRSNGADVASFRVDFSSLDEVRALAHSLLERDEPLHVLVNNAGVWHPRFTRSRDGFEDTFAVNHLAPFLLTNLLLDRMRETEDESRIVHVSSRLHAQAGQTGGLRGHATHLANIFRLPVAGRGARLDLDAVDDPRGYAGLEAYSRSKLAQILFSNELARRLEGAGVTSNAVHPGSVATNVVRDNALLARLSGTAGRLVLKTPAQGARTSVHVATAPELRGVTGRYFANRRPARPAALTADRELARRLWALSAERVGLDD